MAPQPVDVGYLRPWVSVMFLEAPPGLEGSAMGIVRHQLQTEIERRGDMQLVADGLAGQQDDDDLATDALVFLQESLRAGLRRLRHGQRPNITSSCGADADRYWRSTVHTRESSTGSKRGSMAHRFLPYAA